MTDCCQPLRYIYKTHGVCPPEIHIQISGNTLTRVRFVGGGCPGNATLVGRLLQDRPVEDIMPLIEGIPCREDTSCADQLAQALRAIEKGDLAPAAPFRLAQDPTVRSRIGFIGEVGGNPKALRAAFETVAQAGAETVVCLGNITCPTRNNDETIKALRRSGVNAIQGPNDWAYACGVETSAFPPITPSSRDWLLQLPQAAVFQLGDKKCLAFHGDFIQTLPGYSDYDPYALEINMVAGLALFMQDETVFPALAEMTPQFTADVILFAQTDRWGHWQVGGKDFVGIGPVANGTVVSVGLLQDGPEKRLFNTLQVGVNDA